MIEDYDGTVGSMRRFATDVNKQQPGDPKKLAQAFIRLANSANPPVHLLLGKDTLAACTEKKEKLDKEIEEWYDTITGTHYE